MVDNKKLSTRFFFGWVIIGISFLLGMLTTGLWGYTKGIFLQPVATALSASRTDLSVGFMINIVVAALLSPLIGHLLDRYPLKRIMAMIVVWTGFGYFAYAMVQNRWQLFIVLGLFISVTTSVTRLAIPKLILNWFSKRRGLALAIAAMGTPFSGTVAPLVTTWLIDTLGWRGALFCFSALMMLVVLPLVGALKEHPKELGLYPDNQPPLLPVDKSIQVMPFDHALLNRRDYLKKGSFWGLVLIFGIQGTVFYAMVVHLFTHLTDVGTSSQHAARALSLMAIFAMLSKPIFGWILDRWRPWVGVGISITSEIIALLLFLTSTEYVPILVAAVLFGFGFGAVNPLRNGIVALIFGPRNFGSVAGFLQSMMLPLTVMGLPLGGWIYDNLQNYDLMFQLFIAFYLISLLGLIPLRGHGRSTPPAS